MRSHIMEKVRGMRSRYGRGRALALLLATGALAVVPIPGLSLLPVCFAEMALSRKFVWRTP